jgi:hypothetical protein
VCWGGKPADAQRDVIVMMKVLGMSLEEVARATPRRPLEQLNRRHTAPTQPFAACWQTAVLFERISMAELQVPDAEIDAKIDRLLDLAAAPEPSLEIQRSIRGALTASLQPVKPMPSAHVLAVQFSAVFVLFAAALIATMG